MTTKQRVIEILKTRMQFNLECRHNCLKEKLKRETAYLFYNRASEDFELIDEIMALEESEEN